MNETSTFIDVQQSPTTSAVEEYWGVEVLIIVFLGQLNLPRSY